MSVLRAAVFCLLLVVSLASPAIDVTVLPNEELQARYKALTHELRCMQCVNNTIADSPVGLAADLRRQVAEQLVAGKTDAQIRAYMVERYGDVILFEPPVNSSTLWVWLTPLVALAGGLIVAVVIVRRRTKLVATDDSDIVDDGRAG